jgi:hypothetical protein
MILYLTKTKLMTNMKLQCPFVIKNQLTVKVMVLIPPEQITIDAFSSSKIAFLPMSSPLKV